MFVIHENFNKSHDYTRLHLDDCVFVINRKGDQTENTNWHYPFFTYQNARKTANNLGRKNGPFNCKICKPEKTVEDRTMVSTMSNYPKR
jgi:hypothetical protein